MPRIEAKEEVPEKLRPFVSLGVVLHLRGASGEQVPGDCPFCGRERKFSINRETGQWRCYVCNAGEEDGPGAKKGYRGGNVYTFYRLLHEGSGPVGGAKREALASDRGLLSPETLDDWGAVSSALTAEVLLPGYGPDGRITVLYRIKKDPKSGKWVAYLPAGGNHGMFGLGRWDADRPAVWVCEGPWDGMVLSEVLGSVRLNKEGGASRTDDPDRSLVRRVNVVAVPGANVFPAGWTTLFSGRDVVLMFDNDHPRTDPKGEALPSVGYEGMRRAGGLLLASSLPPKTVSYLKWGEEGFDRSLPDGFDLRDAMSSPDLDGRADALVGLVGKVSPAPPQWAEVGALAADEKKDSDCLPCTSWAELIQSWKVAMKWVEGLDRALSVCLASIASTTSVGDQLWVKMIGPPSSGKTVLCEALSINKRFVVAKSVFRGFHSGYKSDREGKEDHSLIPQLAGKTFVLKDGDTLLTLPNLSQVLAEARDLYDTTARTAYRHGMNRDYEGKRMTWILAGTESLRKLDDSELGERFVDVDLGRMDVDLERIIALRVAQRAVRDVVCLADGKVETRDGPEMVEAKRKTGGYISYLRLNAISLLKQVHASDDSLVRIARFAEFVSYMRTRPSKRQEEVPGQRELCFRLTSQFVRLAMCLAVVLNERTLNDDVMRRVRSVALDTARGRTFNVVRYLMVDRPGGSETKPLAVVLNDGEDKARSYLRFMRTIGALTHETKKIAPGLYGRALWRVSPSVAELWRTVTGPL